MRRSRDYAEGTVHRLVHDSDVLANNPLGDPARRELHVWTPAGWTEGERLPLLLDMPGWGGSGMGHTNWKNIGENVPERLDRLVGSGALGRVVVAFPDCITRVGGNQYINSAGTGRYEDYLIQEIVPFVEQRFNCGGEGRRGCFGKSSGGYGAIWHAMHHGDFWAVAACNSGDMGFDALQLPEMYKALDVLREHKMDVKAFFDHFEAANKVTERERHARMFIAMGAHFDPDPSCYLNIRLPCDLHTAERIPERWANWLSYDPSLLADECEESLRRLKGLYMDCGGHDQFRIHFGMRRLDRALTRLGIDHVYEEYDDNHTDVDYRMDIFLPWLVQRLEGRVTLAPTRT
ncbi:MAG: enterochelin esterase [Alphaproteobacteria bacterium]|nr:enterochelin esterase [Alphaproteobacteria bacterium]